MRVALDASHWFVVCLPEDNQDSRHWDQSQIEHIYLWLSRHPTLSLIDLHTDNGFYGLAAGALNRTSLMITRRFDSLQRIQKGIGISGLSQKVRLYTGTENGLECTSECYKNPSSSFNYSSVLAIKPPERAILRVKVDNSSVESLSELEAVFKHLCIPLVILEIDIKLKDTYLASLTKLAKTLISSHGYRPFTFNGIALALNNASEWPEVVYWMSTYDVADPV